MLRHDPVRHVVWDGFGSVGVDDWPDACWSGWVSYDPAYHCKRASDLATSVPASCALLLAEVAALQVRPWFGGQLVPDLSLHGAGLHEVPPGPGVAEHVDADTHPRLGLERVLSAVLYVHEEWRPEWGGELDLAGTRIQPLPGRLVVFDCRSVRHSVRPVVGPEKRRSLALFWYNCQLGARRRLKADFSEAQPQQQRS